MSFKNKTKEEKLIWALQNFKNQGGLNLPSELINNEKWRKSADFRQYGNLQLELSFVYGTSFVPNTLIAHQLANSCIHGDNGLFEFKLEFILKEKFEGSVLTTTKYELKNITLTKVLESFKEIIK